MASQIRIARKLAGKPRSRKRSNPSPAPVRKRLPKNLRAEIIEAYQAGATTRHLASTYGVSKTNIEDLLHRAGTRMRYQPLTPEQITEAQRLHAQGLSTYKIAARFGVAQCTVWRAVKQHGSG